MIETRATSPKRPLRSAWVAASIAAAVLVGAVLVTGCGGGADEAARSAGGEGLRSVASFASVEAGPARAAAFFEEAAKVLMHPRCVNCHPSGPSPHQGENGEPHQPRVERGPDGFGAIGMRCETCHHGANYDPGRVPGAPHWHLAPREMAWEGLSASEICEQLKDPARNGGRDLAAIVEHMEKDPLVAWGWNPGADREPAPGDQASFAALIAAWAEAGAACP